MQETNNARPSSCVHGVNTTACNTDCTHPSSLVVDPLF
ncbi:hypothetical protein CZ787_06700 [Halomonas citrativorans]|uniref:Uncharacterized protein n=1 Tax=Halomonas citrativorans TaxID=2742612 RepID=A0A1R4HXD4_9GAMM|nr:hypothetical protein CZ787_06700 [Halomonas citrativorans]